MPVYEKTSLVSHILFQKGVAVLKQRKGFWERLDLMDEPMPRQVLVELCGDRRVILENHCGVIRYGADMISVRTKQGCILIQGQGLLLRRMCGQQLVITGKIRSITLEGGR